MVKLQLSHSDFQVEVKLGGASDVNLEAIVPGYGDPLCVS